jgi:hypothetical protein
MSLWFSGMLWVTVAAAIPVIIHLAMRTKPRVRLLPTLRFVKTTHRATAAKRRLKHYVLLALRIGIVVLIALLLARPWLRGMRTVQPTDAPTEMVVLVDCSASMQYRHQGRSLLDRGKQVAAGIIEGLPAGSTVEVWTSEGDRSGKMASMEVAREVVSDAQAGDGSRAVGESLAQAVTQPQVRTAGDAPLRREVLVLTDMTRGAWRGMTPIDNSACAVTVIDVGIERGANVSLSAGHVLSPSVPVGQRCTVRASVASPHLGGPQTVRMTMDDAALLQETVQRQAGQSVRVQMTAPMTAVGLHRGKLSLVRDDPLMADNVRYFQVQVSESADVVFVAPAEAGDDTTGRLMAAAIAPAGAGKGLSRRSMLPSQLSQRTLASAPLVVLAGVPSLSDVQWKELERYVERGGRLWVIAGPMVQPASYNTTEAERLLPAELGKQVSAKAPASLSPVESQHPVLAPFDDPANPPLASLRFSRWFSLTSPADNTEVVLRYADATPAIMTRTVGEGEVMFWNLSPTRSWSNMGRLAGQLVVLSQRTTQWLLRSRHEPMNVPIGQVVVLPIPPAMRAATIFLDGPAGKQRLSADAAAPTVRFTPDAPGWYTVSFELGARSEHVGLSANVAAIESDLSRMDAAYFDSQFTHPPQRITSAKQRNGDSTAVLDLDLLPVGILLLLALLLTESFFANRFYKQ